MTRPRTTAVAAALLTTIVFLPGCQSGHSGSSNNGTGTASATTATPSPSTLATATCRTYPHTGQRLGITVPGGFALDEHPKGAAELTSDYRVNLLMRSRHYGDNGQLPVVELTTFAYGPGERKDRSALVQSLLTATNAAGGAGPTSTPTTSTMVAGVAALTGVITSARALNYNTPRPGDSTIRYWALTVSDTQYILVLISRTPALDKRYAEELVAGLHPGGCP
jgi:hypothetical protein